MKWLLLGLWFAVITADRAPAQTHHLLALDLRELHPIHGTTLHDTCDVVAGATAGLDSGQLGETELPNLWPPQDTFYAFLTEDDSSLYFKHEMLPPPKRGSPPYVVDFMLQFQLSYWGDTMVLGCASLPAEFDSVWIQDSIYLTKPGTNFSYSLTHAMTYPDSAYFFTLQPAPGSQYPLRIRIFCNESITGMLQGSAVSPRRLSLLIAPQPARNYVTISGEALSRDGFLTVHDMLGREVARMQATDHLVQINTAELAAGVYSVAPEDHHSSTRTLFIVE